MKSRMLAVLICLLCLHSVQAAEMGYTYRATELKAKPFTDAQTVATLPEKAQVEILTREGAWMQIKASEGKPQGWVRMLSVRLGNPQQRASGGNLLAAIGIGSRPRPQTTATVTTGVRGFSEEDLKQAKPNPAEVKSMERFASTTVQVQQFARSGKLEPRAVPYFDEKGKTLEKGK